ncbi:MAG: phospholipase D-like domain-containing protein [Bryobacteraceae bacterium]|jgi:phosphatidylserine/phosphatidylglycerophosphate/cardiolipin synthase-like enzyme
MARKLIVMPDDTIEPILAAIGVATKSLRIKMFSVSDRRVLSALVKAHRRKVNIRVLLNPARHSGEIQNRGARTVLLDAGIDVLDTNPAFTVTHEKSMVVDDATAFIGSLNWDPDNFEETREFAVISTDADEVAEVTECFEADWSRQLFEPRRTSNLIWCPGHGRQQIADFIDQAKHSLFVQNERYQDAIIVEHLVRAKLRGVKVHVMTRPSHSLRARKLAEGVGDLRIMKDVGIGIHKMKHLKLHAKVLLADRSQMVVGSINLTSSSFDERRELAIQLSDSDVVDRLSKVVHDDWRRSDELDLSERAVLSDLERHPKNGGLAKIAPVGTKQPD